MKKLIVELGLIVFLSLPIAGYAASIGGAETQGQGNFAFGVDTEYVFNRDMKWDGANWSLADSGLKEVKNIEINELYRVMTKLNYGILDSLDVYVKLGMADFEEKTETYNLDGVHAHDITYKGNNGFAYSFGMKAAFDLGNDWLIGTDVQYLRHKNTFSEKTVFVLTSAADTVVEGKATIQEWHVAPYVAMKLSNLTPYLGVKYSDLMVRAPANSGSEEKYKADDNFGVFFGTDVKFDDNISANVEGRFIDETAVSFALAYQF